MNVVVTMAGAGSRFRDSGFTVPKYEIEIHGRTLFYWAVSSLCNFAKSGWTFTFVTLRSDSASDFVRKSASLLGLDEVRIVELEEITNGQATSALAARPAIGDASKPFVVYNIDTFVCPRYLLPSDAHGSGWIPCFPGEGQCWSFARVDQKDRVFEFKEKQRISDHASVGLYWFDSFLRYEELYHRTFPAMTESGPQEYYISAILDRMVNEQTDVFIHRLPGHAVVPLGTPGQLDEELVQRRLLQ
jgi:NDP-sugar pyrophosphorylase family protein